MQLRRVLSQILNRKHEMFLNVKNPRHALGTAYLNRKHEMFLNLSSLIILQAQSYLNRKHEMFLNLLPRHL